MGILTLIQRAKTDAIIAACGVVAGAALGVLGTVHWTKTHAAKAAAIERTAQPEKRLADGALELARVPAQAGSLPEGVSRRVTVDFTPLRDIQAGQTVHVVLDAIQTPKGTREVASASPGVEMTGGQDEVGPVLPPIRLNTKAAWVLWDRRDGLAVAGERSWGPVSVMVEAAPRARAVKIGVGIIF